MGVKYVKDGEEGWIPVVWRKKSARSKASNGNLNVNNNNKKSLVMYRNLYQ